MLQSTIQKLRATIPSVKNNTWFAIIQPGSDRLSRLLNRTSLPCFVRVTCKYLAYWFSRSLVRGRGVLEPSLLNDAIQLSKNVGGKIKTRFVYTDNESGSK